MIRFPYLSIEFIRLIRNKIHDMEFFGDDCGFVVLWSGVDKKERFLLESWYYGQRDYLSPCRSWAYCPGFDFRYHIVFESEGDQNRNGKRPYHHR